SYGCCGQDHYPVNFKDIQKIGTHHCDQSKKKKNKQISKTHITISAVADRIFDRCYYATNDKNKKDNCVKKILASKGGINKKQGKGQCSCRRNYDPQLHFGNCDHPALNCSCRTYSVFIIGSLHPVTIIICKIGEYLEAQGRTQGKTKNNNIE